MLNKSIKKKVNSCGLHGNTGLTSTASHSGLSSDFFQESDHPTYCLAFWSQMCQQNQYHVNAATSQDAHCGTCLCVPLKLTLGKHFHGCPLGARKPHAVFSPLNLHCCEQCLPARGLALWSQSRGSFCRVLLLACCWPETLPAQRLLPSREQFQFPQTGR